MTFADDDLKRLKEEIRDPIYQRSEHRQLVLFKAWALLARLEAAENLMQKADCSCIGHSPCHCGFEEYYKAWRKAAGKSYENLDPDVPIDSEDI
jgi:hypothetical protein